MGSINLYESVHKGLRAELLDVYGSVSRADFALEADTRRVLVRLRGALDFLREHSHHEDRHVMPLVAQANAELAAELAREHAQVEASLNGLSTLLDALELAGVAQRLQLGRTLHSRLTHAVAMQLMHMEREETEAHQALGSKFDDAELERAHSAILADLSPLRMAQWLELMLPAMTRPERADFLGALQGRVPAEMFVTLTTPARRKLGHDEWARATRNVAPAFDHPDFVASETVGVTP